MYDQHVYYVSARTDDGDDGVWQRGALGQLRVELALPGVDAVLVHRLALLAVAEHSPQLLQLLHGALRQARGVCHRHASIT